jgi:hypothetical protein
MAPKPKPTEDGPERWRWYDEADRETREAHPNGYWFHAFNGPPEYWWHEQRISEEEYRANAEPWALERLNAVTAAPGP